MRGGLVGRLRVVGALSVAAVVLAPVLAGPAAATDDTHWAKQWGPAKIGAPAAWASTTGAGVTIGVVDTGIDLGHEDLAGKIVAHTACVGTGGDAAKCSGSAQDEDGHGTHVAGIAAATKDNARGIAGIAPDAKLVVAKVFRGDTASLDDVKAGVQWVVDRGARVVNLSLETTSLLGLFGGGGGAELATAVEYAWSRGAVPVIAAGNASLFSSSANYGTANALVVGATGRSDELASYSVPTGSAKWAILAPGGNSAQGGIDNEIYSTFLGNRYAHIQGTSMAVPHVSGAVALLLARGLTPQRAVEVLLSTADRSVACGANSPTCAGRLDVGRAVATTGAPPPAPPAPPPTQPPPPPAQSPPQQQPAGSGTPSAGPAPTSPVVTTTRPPSTSTTAGPVTTTAPTSASGPAVSSVTTAPSSGGGIPGAALEGVSSTDPTAPPEDTLSLGSAPNGAAGSGAADERSLGGTLSASGGNGTAAGGSQPAGFRGAAAIAAALLALALAGLVVRPPARRLG